MGSRQIFFNIPEKTLAEKVRELDKRLTALDRQCNSLLHRLSKAKTKLFRLQAQILWGKTR
jgi:chromosome segregation ATPase